MTIRVSNESDFRDLIIRGLSARGWLVDHHEDKISPNIPDLSFSGHSIDGWMELKWIGDTSVSGPSVVSNLTAGQTRWLMLHGMKGSGNCYLVIGGVELSMIVPWRLLPILRPKSTWRSVVRNPDIIWIAGSDSCAKIVSKIHAQLTKRGGLITDG